MARYARRAAQHYELHRRARRDVERDLLLDDAHCRDHGRRPDALAQRYPHVNLPRRIRGRDGRLDARVDARKRHRLTRQDGAGRIAHLEHQRAGQLGAGTAALPPARHKAAALGRHRDEDAMHLKDGQRRRRRWRRRRRPWGSARQGDRRRAPRRPPSRTIVDGGEQRGLSAQQAKVVAIPVRGLEREAVSPHQQRQLHR